MLINKVKQNGQRLLQVYCHDLTAIKKALAYFGQYLYKRQGIKGDVFLYFKA